MIAEIDAGILAPNLSVEAALVLKLGNKQIGHVEFGVRLDQARQTVRTKCLNLTALGLGTSPRPQVLSVIALIAGKELGRQSVAIRSHARLTNFEGQLTTDPRQLEVDDSEYERILSQL